MILACPDTINVSLLLLGSLKLYRCPYLGLESPDTPIHVPRILHGVTGKLKPIPRDSEGQHDHTTQTHTQWQKPPTKNKNGVPKECGEQEQEANEVTTKPPSPLTRYNFIAMNIIKWHSGRYCTNSVLQIINIIRRVMHIEYKDIQRYLFL